MRILILTSIYPSTEAAKNTTPVVHYFCREWVKEGHNCIVIHNDNKYPLLFYFLPAFLKKRIEGKLGIVSPTWSHRRKSEYILDSVFVIRIPMLKWLPFMDFLPFQKKRQVRRIIAQLDFMDFQPDVILGHWETPQIDLIFDLKNIYRGVKTCCVIHAIRYSSNLRMMRKLTEFDAVGFRNRALAQDYLTNFQFVNRNIFICKSGLPNHFLATNEDALLSKHSIKNICITYVGGLITRKNPVTIINAVSHLENVDLISLKFIGEGPEKSDLLRKHKELIPYCSVDFISGISRDEVFLELCGSTVFIMVSSGEAFGLVYAEAMAAGCIVIASKYEGFDGIISHGVNGFLCSAGDDFELARLLDVILRMKLEDRKLIAHEAIKTARSLSDKSVARDYINSVI